MLCHLRRTHNKPIEDQIYLAILLLKKINVGWMRGMCSYTVIPPSPSCVGNGDQDSEGGLLFSYFLLSHSTRE